MGAATWAILIVPALTIVAIGDSLTGLSALLSRKLGLTNRFWVHIGLLFLCLVAFIVGLRRSFPLYSPFAIFVDYPNVENHPFSLFIAPWLMVLEALLIPCSIVIALVFSIKQGRSMLLSVLGAILGNVGTIIWIVRDQRSSPDLAG